MQPRSRSSRLVGLAMGFGLVAAGSIARADNLPIVTDVEFQPLSAQVKRIAEALELLGQPLARRREDASR